MLFDDLEKQGADTILNSCAGLKKSEKLLIAYDSPSDRRPEILFSLAQEKGAPVSLEIIEGNVSREPSSNISRKMLENDVTIFCVNEERTLLWGHADAKVAAIQNGGRVLFLTQSIESTPLTRELEEIRNRSLKLANILEKAHSIVILTGEFKLEVKLGGRQALRLSSILREPGSWGAVPDYAEAAVAPLEDSSNGDLRIDGIIVGLGKVTEPVDLHFESGRLTRISGGKIARDFDRILGTDPSARVLCELGFGTNHLRKEIRGEFDDKKALGTLHIALGDNHTFGGLNRSSLHIDCLVLSPRVLIDDKPIDLKSL